MLYGFTAIRCIHDRALSCVPVGHVCRYCCSPCGSSVLLLPLLTVVLIVVLMAGVVVCTIEKANMMVNKMLEE